MPIHPEMYMHEYTGQIRPCMSIHKYTFKHSGKGNVHSDPDLLEPEEGET